MCGIVGLNFKKTYTSYT